MSLIRCEVCGRPICEDIGSEWLKVLLPGKERHYIYVKEYECECSHKMYNTQMEEVSDEKK